MSDTNTVVKFDAASANTVANSFLGRFMLADGQIVVACAISNLTYHAAKLGVKKVPSNEKAPGVLREMGFTVITENVKAERRLRNGSSGFVQPCKVGIMIPVAIDALPEANVEPPAPETVTEASDEAITAVSDAELMQELDAAIASGVDIGDEGASAPDTALVGASDALLGDLQNA